MKLLNPRKPILSIARRWQMNDEAQKHMKNESAILNT